MKLDDAVLRVARSEAQAMLDNLSGVVAVIVSTVDGFDVASAVTRGVDPVRVAAMASSIAAIGAVVSQEAGLGRTRSVTINTDKGFALVSSARRTDVELVINVIADANAVLAQVAYRCNEAVKALQSA